MVVKVGSAVLVATSVGKTASVAGFAAEEATSVAVVAAGMEMVEATVAALAAALAEVAACG